MRRPALILIACCLPLAAPPAAIAGIDRGEARLQASLATLSRQLGPSSGVFVLDATERDLLFKRRERRARIIASNAKLFTTTALLARLSPTGMLETRITGAGEKQLDGSFAGDLYLRGSGDPSLNDAGIRELARQIEEVAQVSAVSGRVIGDESAFDALRGGPSSGFGPSPDHPPLGALALNQNRGLGGRSPALRAAAALDDALEHRGVPVRRAPASGSSPPDATQLAGLFSPDIGRLIRATNKESSNFFAEMLLKVLDTADGDQGTTRGGAAEARRFAAQLGSRARLADGSGLSRSNRASPRAVVELLDEIRDRPEFQAFFRSLAIAGIDGTLDDPNHRGLRHRPALGRCRAKTGTLRDVSAISGYCRALSEDTIVFSILSNAVAPNRVKQVEDRMVQAIVRYG